MSLTQAHYSTSYSDLTAAFTVSTGHVKVTSILLANTAASAVTVIATTGDGVTTLFQVRVPANASVTWPLDAECNFSNGLAFSVGVSTTHVTVVVSREF